MIDVAHIAFRRFLRARAATIPNLPDQRANPLSALRVEASGDPAPPPGIVSPPWWIGRRGRSVRQTIRSG